MQLDENHLTRLGFIKYMFTLGQAQAGQPSPTHAAGLLMLHDAVELFLQLAAEVSGVSKSSTGFMDYWSLLSDPSSARDLPLRESMRRFNKARVQLKHHGFIPSQLDMEGFRATCTSFLEESISLLFGLTLDQISLIDLISFPQAKARLKDAEKALERGESERAIGHVAVAFDMLLREYRKEVEAQYDSPRLRYRADDTFLDPFLSHWDMRDLGLDKLHRSLERIDTALRLISLGIDYEKYRGLRAYWPGVFLPVGRDDYVIQTDADIPVGTREVTASLRFVVDVALRLRERLEVKRGD